MVSDHILPIILSNCSCHVSYRIGVLSKCLFCIVEMPTHTHVSRCTARVDGLDDEICGRRSREHTDMLVEAFELGVLWDEYGLVGDVIVSVFPVVST